MFRHFYEILFILAGVLIIALNFNFLADYPIVFEMINLAGGLIAVVPSLLIFYSKFRRKSEIDSQFLVFIGDVTQAINSGMTLPLALQSVSKRDYGPLSKHVNNLASQVDWGIPFPKALEIFGKKTGSVLIRRSAETITQTYEVGGKLAETLDSIGETLQTIEKIKKERMSSVHSQIITSYIIYFVFILILVILQIFLIPSLLPGAFPTLPGSSAEPLQKVFAASFFNFIVVQGFFAGLVTGKLAEGSIIAGFKHSVLLISIGYAIFSFSSQIEVKFL